MAKTPANQTSKNLEKVDIKPEATDEQAPPLPTSTIAADAAAADAAAKTAADAEAARADEARVARATAAAAADEQRVREAAEKAARDALGDSDQPPEALFSKPTTHDGTGPQAGEQPQPNEPGPIDAHPGKPGTFSLEGSNWFYYDGDRTLRPYTGETGPFVDFISRDPGLRLQLGDVVVRFDLGRVTVPAPIAERMQRHMLFSTGKFYLADEVAVIGGDIVSYRDNANFRANLIKARDGKVVMYATKGNPNLIVNFGDFQVRFEDGYAAVPSERQARVETHMFYREQRITRLDTV